MALFTSHLSDGSCSLTYLCQIRKCFTVLTKGSELAQILRTFELEKNVLIRSSLPSLVPLSPTGRHLSFCCLQAVRPRKGQG